MGCSPTSDPLFHDRTIVTDLPEQMRAIDLSDDGNFTPFVLVDQCTDECRGFCAALQSTRFETIEYLC
jgi:hypothetical protein